MKHNIWSNDVNAEFDTLKENYKNNNKDISDESIFDEAYHNIDINLEDTLANLDIDCPNNIILIGNLVRWNGTYDAHKETNTKNLAEAIKIALNSFGNDNSFDLYVENDNLYLAQLGHDNPVNPSIFKFKYLIPNFEDNFDPSNKNDLMFKTTGVGKSVSEIYGWLVK